MGEFFRGWRRKAACFILFISWVLTAVWLRSYVTFDEIIVWHNRFDIVSQNGELILLRNSFEFETWPIFSHEVTENEWCSFDDQFKGQETKWRAGFCGVNVGAFNYKNTDGSSGSNTLAFIPYACLVAPMTILCACLFLLPNKRVNCSSARVS